MAPSATETVTPTIETLKQKVAEAAAAPEKAQEVTHGGAVGSAPLDDIDDRPHLEINHREPLKLSGALEQFKYFDSTPVIGREFVDVDLAEWLRAPNSDELLRDLAITISRRGVVFFRKQDNITNELQKELVQRLGELSGKPATSGLHIHPVINASRDRGGHDNEISVISSVQNRKLYRRFAQNKNRYDKPQTRRLEWHSDITFEPVPSDYALLRLIELPSTGGDTLWASGYEVYDRLSAPVQRFLEGLTSHCAQPVFNESAADNGFEIFSGQRGAPENVGEVLEARHPVIRTNPVTGWKSVFAVGNHVQRIEGLTDDESRHFLSWFVDLIVGNHDLQVRNRWQNLNDLAIWDNRSVYHAATPDYHEAFGEREGSRAVSLGERPYFDPQSTGRKESLAKEGVLL
ncbi:putative alpha-ketoglutarate-dependent sulfonate dioxygenase protein [Rosellinia necatrix]|uniref:Putative alpha-ketoglutarate-dependent sulfonate dioxygenase protein n=1 Tax=Rosellinia necatrix TaxID=77044 RepID=A0A1W2TML0_ROSNE|nr:putative alpha-ketoglutarate-dependent sulfonate dioxygenase protein [Rosellinia necatrix]